MKCGSVVTNARIFTTYTPFRTATIPMKLLAKLDTIRKLQIFEIGDRENETVEELLCNIVTTDSVVATY
jgi:hypothetical protein